MGAALSPGWPKAVTRAGVPSSCSSRSAYGDPQVAVRLECREPADLDVIRRAYGCRERDRRLERPPDRVERDIIDACDVGEAA